MSEERAYRVKSDGTLAPIVVYARHGRMVAFRYADDDRYGWAPASSVITDAEGDEIVRARIKRRIESCEEKIAKQRKAQQEAAAAIERIESEIASLRAML